MKIFKTVVASGAAIVPVDTISYEGGLWLVPCWTPASDRQCLMPARMIRIDLLSLRKLHPRLPWDYHLLDHVPDDVLGGAVAANDCGPFEIIDRPKNVVREIGSFDS
jgi:hypothetical protein